MKSKKPSRRQMLTLCEQLYPGDGVDPREEAREDSSGRRTNRKTLQLCAQVARALAHVLAGECGDDALRDLIVLEVAPAPNASRLIVTVGPSGAGEPPKTAAILDGLANHAGKIRCEVAAAITRKRAPELIYRVQPRMGDERVT